MSALPALGRELAEATAPPERRGVARDEVRLLVTDRARGAHRHARFVDLPQMLRAGDVLVVNDSATLPAALEARRPNGIALTLHVATAIDARLFIAEPRGAVEAGEHLALPAGAYAVALAPVDPARPRLWYVAFHVPVPMETYLGAHGTPIRYGYVTERFPIEDYQTIFGSKPGSAEMPSAARPFTRRVLEALRAREIALVAVTLHCGVSSFERPEIPGIERFAVSARAAELVNRARAERRRIIAVGTTALRALESAADGGDLTAASGWTNKVITAPRDVTVASGLLTGFHDAAATHQGILDAFLSAALREGAYDEAARTGYLRHEFGDVHLIL